MRILVAPDSFKGSATAGEVADGLRLGWLDARPGDTVRTLPLADGGEGTLDVIARTSSAYEWRTTRVDGPAGPRAAPWLRHVDGTAVVELAAVCGLPLWPEPDPMGAHTYALGQVLRAAVADPGVHRVVVALGGSASTDGGVGALRALGARLHGPDGVAPTLGAAGVGHLTGEDVGPLVPPPADGVELLVDVDAPLLGPRGAAAQFGPQKGATPAQVEALDRALAVLAAVLGGHPEQPGAGAAGGTAYGLSAAWGARLRPGSATVAELVGLDEALLDTDLVITGEGCLDEQSLRGKVVGHVADAASRVGVPTWACVGRVDAHPGPVLTRVCALVDLAGSADRAVAAPGVWLREAGRLLAGSLA